MALYINRTLMPGEVISYIAKIHRAIYSSCISLLLFAVLLVSYGDNVAQMILAGQGAIVLHYVMYIVAIITGVMGAFDLMFTYLRLISTELVVTNQRIILKYGMFGVQIYQALLSKVTGVDIEQTSLGRLEGYGTVTVLAAASHIPPIDHVADPFRFQSHVMQNNVQQIMGAELEEIHHHSIVSPDQTHLIGSSSRTKHEK